MTNKDGYSWLILLCVRVQRAKPKTYRQAPTHWLKFYEEAFIDSEARYAVVEFNRVKHSHQQWLGW